MSSHVAAGLRAQVTTTLLGLWSLWIYRRIPVATVFFVAAVIISGGIGHAAAIDPIVNVPAKAIHLVACAAWIGGVLWLVTRDRTDVTLFARESARVSTVALAAAIAVLVTGAAQTLIMLASPPDLVRTGYGVLILTKFLGFMVLIAFGWHHRFHALPRLATTGSSAAGFRISLRRELIVMAAVIGLGALLAYTPAPAPAAAPGTTSIPSSPTHEHNP
jgi:putative copper resistance protein D